jgi:hypothetical protein
VAGCCGSPCDMPGSGEPPEPVMPYHLWTLAPLLNGLLEQFGYQQADVLGISDRDRLGPEQPAPPVP